MNTIKILKYSETGAAAIQHSELKML